MGGEVRGFDDGAGPIGQLRRMAPAAVEELGPIPSSLAGLSVRSSS